MNGHQMASRILTLALGVLIVGFGAQGLSAQQPTPEPADAGGLPPIPRKPFTPPDWAPLPDDLEIVVIREDVIPGQFRILDVELSREVDEETIEVIANLLRDDDDMIYQRTYIVYYLPGMASGEVGWATSHFTPDLEIRVLDPS
jgi:hypothetical protein